MPSEVHLSYLTAVFTNDKALVEKRYYTNLRQLNSLPHPMNLHNFVYNRNGEYCIIHFCGISMKSWLSIFFDSSHFWLTQAIGIQWMNNGFYLEFCRKTLLVMTKWSIKLQLIICNDNTMLRIQRKSTIW